MDWANNPHETTKEWQKNNNIKHYLYRILDKTTKTGAPLVEIQGRGSCLRLHGIISDLINFLADR